MKLGKSWLERLLSTDNRRSSRQQAPGFVAYYWDGATPMAHRIQNICATGFYLLTKERWPPGTVVTMTLQRTNAADTSPERYISVQSKVIWLGDDGVGFAFVPLEAKDSSPAENLKSRPVGRKALDAFLEHLKSDPGP